MEEVEVVAEEVEASVEVELWRPVHHEEEVISTPHLILPHDHDHHLSREERL